MCTLWRKLFDPARRDLGVQRLLALVAVLAGLE